MIVFQGIAGTELSLCTDKTAFNHKKQNPTYLVQREMVGRVEIFYETRLVVLLFAPVLSPFAYLFARSQTMLIPILWKRSSHLPRMPAPTIYMQIWYIDASSRVRVDACSRCSNNAKPGWCRSTWRQGRSIPKNHAR
jgi:hypothetical protein